MEFHLPDEMWREILRFVSRQDLTRSVLLVNKKFHRLALELVWHSLDFHSADHISNSRFLTTLDLALKSIVQEPNMILSHAPCLLPMNRAVSRQRLKRRSASLAVQEADMIGDDLEKLSVHDQTSPANKRLKVESNMSKSLARRSTMPPVVTNSASPTCGSFVRNLRIYAPHLFHSSFNEKLCRFLYSCPKLLCVDLAQCSVVNDATLRALYLNSGSSLVELNLSFCANVTDFGICQISLHCHRLKKLILDGCELIGDDSVLSLSRQCLNIRHISFFGCHRLSQVCLVGIASFPCLETLNLGHCNGISDISALTRCQSIRCLNLSGHPVFPDSMVAPILRGMSYLEDLNLEGCTDLSGPVLASLVSPIRRINLTFLRYLTNGDLTTFCHRARQHLIEIFLGKCGMISNEAIIYMARTCLNLTHVYLAGNRNVTDEAIFELVKHLRLRVLSIPGCSITDASVLAAAKNCHRSLEIAQFSFCNDITANSVGFMAYHCKRYSQPCPSNLLYRYNNCYCAIRPPMIEQLGLYWSLEQDKQ